MSGQVETLFPCKVYVVHPSGVAASRPSLEPSSKNSTGAFAVVRVCWGVIATSGGCRMEGKPRPKQPPGAAKAPSQMGAVAPRPLGRAHTQ